MPTARLARTAAVAVFVGLVAGCGGGAAIANPADVIDTFVTQTQASDRSMHVTASGRIKTTMFATTFTSTYDFNGSDYTGIATIEMPALGRIGLEVMRVGDIGFTRFGDRDWGAGDAGTVPGADPFADLAAATIVDAGTEHREGRTLLHLQVTEPLALVGALALSTDQNVRNATALTGTYDVYVDQMGVPVSGSASINGFLTGEITGPFTSTVTFTVSGWGSEVTIDPPFPVNTFPRGTTFVADNGTSETLTWRDSAGIELVVPPCTRASSTTFDGRRFTVSTAEGLRIDGTEPGDSATWMWSFEGSGGVGRANGIPYTASMAPCLAAP